MKTKKLFLLLFAIILSCGHTWGQDDLPYRQFQAFNQDTIRYLDYNFTIRNDQYIGKTVGDLINDLELPVVYVSNLIMQMRNTPKSNIYIVAMNLVIRLVRNGEEDGDDSKDYYIKIVFKNALDSDDYVNALISDKRNTENSEKINYAYWTPQLYELLRNYELEFVIANDSLLPDRGKLRKSNTWEDIEKINKIVEAEKSNWKKRIQAEKQAVEK